MLRALYSPGPLALFVHFCFYVLPRSALGVHGGERRRLRSPHKRVRVVIFRFRYQVAGGHVHIRMFAGYHDGALGKCGDLCMRHEEFEVFREAATFIQFIPEIGGPRS